MAETRPAVRVTSVDDVARALAALGFRPPEPVLVLVGGAAGMDDDALRELQPVFDEALVPFATGHGATVIDGGTDAGVMQLIGRARARGGASFRLLGVVVAALAASVLEPNHSHFMLVDGSRWGDESPWIAAAADVLAAQGPQATVVIDGGDIAWADVEQSVAAGRPVVAVRGTGRTADEVAAAITGGASDSRGVRVADSGLVTVVSADPPQVLHEIERVFGRSS